VTPAPIANSVGRFLYEAKPSVLAARLDDVLAARHGLKRLTAGIGYLSSDQQITSEPLLSGFEILEDLPFRKHILRQRVAALDGEVREVKKRGVDVNPNRLQRELAHRGSNLLTVILLPLNGARRALIARRLTDACPNGPE
jgi:hypothetical protein